MEEGPRPWLSQQGWCDGVFEQISHHGCTGSRGCDQLTASSKGTSNHCAVEHGNEEDLRVEKCPQGVDKCIPSLSPLRLAVEESHVVL